MVTEENRVQVNPVCGLWFTIGFVRLTAALKAVDEPSVTNFIPKIGRCHEGVLMNNDTLGRRGAQFSIRAYNILLLLIAW